MLQMLAARRWCAILAAFFCAIGASRAGETFQCEITNPTVTISIPELPPIKMIPHRESATKPHLRLEGDSGPFIVTVMAPTSEPGMTPYECATWTVNSIIQQERLSNKNVRVRKSPDAKTYGMFYVLTIEKVVMLKARILSSTGTQCIQVHITKVGTASEIDKWLQGFPAAKIEALGQKKTGATNAVPSAPIK